MRRGHGHDCDDDGYARWRAGCLCVVCGGDGEDQKGWLLNDDNDDEGGAWFCCCAFKPTKATTPAKHKKKKKAPVSMCRSGVWLI